MNSLTSLVLGVRLLVPCVVLSLAGLAAAADPPFAGNPAAGLAGSSPAGAAKTAGAKDPAGAASPAFALEVDSVAFGMSADQVARLYDRWWDRHFVAKYRKANPGPKTKELDYQLEEQKKLLRRVTNFDGRTATYDKSEFREEFAHGNGETMSSIKVLRRGSGADAKGVSYTRRFFYFQDKLWKVYDEYRLEAQSPLGADFKDATERVAASLGPKAKRTRGTTSQWENVLFDTGAQRVRVIKLAADRVALVRADSALTKAVLDGRAQHAPAPEAGLDPDTRAALR
ncbi:MAG: hypothetical protein ABI895_25575 [Deltaproteobacteria bacterium]